MIEYVPGVEPQALETPGVQTRIIRVSALFVKALNLDKFSWRNMAYQPSSARVFVALHGITVVFCGLAMLILWEFMDIRRARVESRRINKLSVASIVMYWITSIVYLLSLISIQFHVNHCTVLGHHKIPNSTPSLPLYFRGIECKSQWLFHSDHFPLFHLVGIPRGHRWWNGNAFIWNLLGYFLENGTSTIILVMYRETASFIP